MAGTAAEATTREVAATKTEIAEGFGIEKNRTALILEKKGPENNWLDTIKSYKSARQASDSIGVALKDQIKFIRSAMASQ